MPFWRVGRNSMLMVVGGCLEVGALEVEMEW